MSFPCLSPVFWFFIASINLAASQSAASVFLLLFCPATITTLQRSILSSPERRNLFALPDSASSGISARSTSGLSETMESEKRLAFACARTPNTVAKLWPLKIFLPKPGKAGCFSSQWLPRERKSAPGNEREIL
jgi:hypothetical protein